jgi:hypothetical protein
MIIKVVKIENKLELKKFLTRLEFIEKLRALIIKISAAL